VGNSGKSISADYDAAQAFFSHQGWQVDEVDRILAAWAGEAPGLDTAPMAVFSRINRVARRFERIRQKVFSAHQLETWEFDMLAALRRSGPPYELTPGELIQDTLSTSAAMTNRVDRLSERGLVLRRRDDSDRRKVRVSLTKAGSMLVEAALADLVNEEHALLETLPAAEHERLAAALRELLLVFEAR
jgi:DNA-binding MarR family transcriptional regulator